MRRAPLGVVLSTSLAFAACGGDEATPAGAPSATPTGNAVVVKMKDVRFVPENVKVKAGQTVRWVNEDAVEHDAVARSGADFKSELFGQGGSFETRLDAPGKVDYVCSIHPTMTGTITVE